MGFTLAGTFSPQPLGPIAFGPVVRKHIRAGVCGEANLFTSWQVYKERKEEPGAPQFASRARPPNT
jgi:hypothetical protein